MNKKSDFEFTKKKSDFDIPLDAGSCVTRVRRNTLDISIMVVVWNKGI
jgi:hypothetical protein